MMESNIRKHDDAPLYHRVEFGSKLTRSHSSKVFWPPLCTVAVVSSHFVKIHQMVWPRALFLIKLWRRYLPTC